MQTIEAFTLPDEPECSVDLPQGVRMIDADVDEAGDIKVYYMDPYANDKTVTLTWYAFGLGMAIPDAFAGQFFKRVLMEDGYPRFLFFKQDPPKRKPIIANIPNAKPKPTTLRELEKSMQRDEGGAE